MGGNKIKNVLIIISEAKLRLMSPLCIKVYVGNTVPIHCLMMMGHLLAAPKGYVHYTHKNLGIAYPQSSGALCLATIIHMCWASWAGWLHQLHQVASHQICCGGKHSTSFGYSTIQHNTNLTQHTSTHNNQHTTRWHDTGRRPPRPLPPPIPPASALAQFASSPHWVTPGTLGFVFFCAVGVAWCTEKATHHEMERGAGPRP
jgi:hypothetical protein